MTTLDGQMRRLNRAINIAVEHGRRQLMADLASAIAWWKKVRP